MNKKLLIALLAVILLAAPTFGAMTNSASDILKNAQNVVMSNQYMNPLYLWTNEAQGIITGTTGYTGATLYVVPQSATPSETDEGRLYYDSDTDKLYVYANGSWSDLTAAAGTPAGADTQMQYNNNGAFGAIANIIWDDTNLEFADDQSVAFGTNADWTLNFDDSVDDQLIFLTAGTAAGATTDPLFEIIVGAVPTADQQVFGVAKGTQSSNTALLTLDEDGDLVVAGSFAATGGFTGDVTLSSAETITNTTDSEITFTQNSGEDLAFDMDAGTNAVGLKSSTGVDELALGAVDDLTGVGTIVFDVAASSITLPSTGGAEDLTIALTGATDSSIKLESSGTGADAISLTTSAGGLDLTVAGAAGGEDLDLTSNTSIRAIASEAAADDAIVIQAAGAGSGIQITSLADIDITTTGAATEDISITNTGGSINITANENDADVIVIATTGGGGTSESINIQNDQGTAETAIDIDATAGGIDVDFATGKDMAITGGQFSFTSNEAVASAFAVTTNTGGAETIVLTNTQGNTAAAINLIATAGGVKVDAAAASSIELNAQVVLENDQIIEGVNNNRIEFSDNAESLELIFDTDKIELGAGSTGVVTLDFNDIDALEDIDTITLENALVIDNSTDNRFRITENSDSLVFIMGSDKIELGHSKTSVATIDFNDVDALEDVESIAGDGTGAIEGFFDTVVNDSDGMAQGTLTAADAGTVITNAGAGGAQSYVLPEGSTCIGAKFTFVVMAANALRVDPYDATDQIILVTDTAGDYYEADAVGETLIVQCVANDNWVVLSSTGTWTEQ